MRMQYFPCPIDAPKKECLIAATVYFTLVAFHGRLELRFCNCPCEIAFDMCVNFRIRQLQAIERITLGVSRDVR